MASTNSRKRSGVNRRVKHWSGWVLLLFVVAGLLAVGASRASGPQTPEDRIDDISRRVACPVCDGESVFESQNSASRAIRNQVGELVAENDLSDDAPTLRSGKEADQEKFKVYLNGFPLPCGEDETK